MPDVFTPGGSITEEQADHALYVKLRPGPGQARQRVQRHQQARLRGAMVEAVASHGYQGVTVRRLVGLAGVSTATFYKHFSGVEDCFASTYHALTKRILARAKGAPDIGQGDGLAVTLSSLLADFTSSPKESRLVLLEAYAAGPGATSRVSRVDEALGKLIATQLPPSSGRSALPQVATGLTAAVTRAARTSLDGGRMSDPGQLGSALAAWSLLDLGRGDQPRDSWPGASMGDRRARPRDPLLQRLESAPDHRSRVRAAMVRLTLAHGLGNVTRSQICAQASVPRRVFDREFDSVHEALVDLSGEIVAETATHAWDAAIRSRDPVATIESMSAVICHSIELNPSLAHLCWVEVPGHGLEGLTATDRWISDAVPRIASLFRRRDDAQIPLDAILAAIWRILQRLIEERRIGEIVTLSHSFSEGLLQTPKRKTSLTLS
jgi:AcrR family transcriptional regulator